MMRFVEFVKQKFAFVFVTIACLGVFLLGKQCGSKSRDQEIAGLSTKLAASEKTVEVKDGLFATKVVEINDLTALFNSSKGEWAKQNDVLKKQVSDMNARLLTAQQLTLQWKKAYEAELSATQGTVPPSDGGGKTRERVDFAGDLGPIHASGYTMTDPADAHLKLEQTRPLLLSVSVARASDGTWTSLVTSSDPDVDVKVGVAGVDLAAVKPTWRQRVWLDLGVNAFFSPGASFGLSYHFDTWSLGASCVAWSAGLGCGANLGFKIFK